MKTAQSEKIKKSVTWSIINFLIFAIAVLVWEIASANKLVDPLFFGRPSEIIKEGFELITSGTITMHLVESGIAFFIGIILAIIIGTILGLKVGSSSRLKDISKPYIYGLNSLPFVVMLPIIIIWFGANTYSEIFVIFIMASLPIIINTMESVETIDPKLIKMAKSFRASNRFILKEITFYHALPYTFSGIRLGIGKALVGLIIAELYGLGRGIGYLISFYGNTLQINKLFFIISLILLANYLIIKSLNILELKLKGRFNL